MAELENEEYLDEEQDAITQEELIELRVKAERLEKAEKALVSLKQEAKKAKTTDNGFDIDSIVEKKLSEKEKEREVSSLLSNNSEFADFKDKLSEHIGKGLTLNQAKILVEQDQEFQNRKKSNSMNLTDGDIAEKSVYSENELVNMSQSAYNKAMERVESGKARIS